MGVLDRARWDLRPSALDPAQHLDRRSQTRYSDRAPVPRVHHPRDSLGLEPTAATTPTEEAP